MTLALLFLLLTAAATALSAWSSAAVKRFLATTPVIADQQCLDRFKAVARRDMYVALSVIVLQSLNLVVIVMLVNRYPRPGFLLVLATFAIVIAWSRQRSTFAKRARALEATSGALGNEHRRISQTWVRKPFPDF